MAGRPNETCRRSMEEDLMRRVGDPWREHLMAIHEVEHEGFRGRGCKDGSIHVEMMFLGS